MAAFGKEVGIYGAIAAEALSITGGLSPDRAPALQTNMKRNKVPSVETTVDESIAARFRNTIPFR